MVSALDSKASGLGKLWPNGPLGLYADVRYLTPLDCYSVAICWINRLVLQNFNFNLMVSVNFIPSII